MLKNKEDFERYMKETEKLIKRQEEFHTIVYGALHGGRERVFNRELFEAEKNCAYLQWLLDENEKLYAELVQKMNKDEA